LTSNDPLFLRHELKCSKGKVGWKKYTRWALAEGVGWKGMGVGVRGVSTLGGGRWAQGGWGLWDGPHVRCRHQRLVTSNLKKKRGEETNLLPWGVGGEKADTGQARYR